MKQYQSSFRVNTLQELENATGTLDFLEFLVSPSNELTDEENLIFAIMDYFSILGFSSDEVRQYILQEMQMFRKQKYHELMSKDFDIAVRSVNGRYEIRKIS